MAHFETLMPIRTKGSEPPIFFVHGEPLRMAQRMLSDRPIYGLSHVYHSDFTATPESIESLAATYLSEIQQIQPEGPYHLCGFSAGGMLAFEIARQIRGQQQEVGSLILVDPAFISFEKNTQRVMAEIAQRKSLIDKFVYVAKRAPKAVYARTRNRLIMLLVRLYWLLNIPTPERLRWLGYLKSLGPAMRKYSYEPIDCRGTVLYGALDEFTEEGCRKFWSNLLSCGARVEVFPDVHKHQEFMLDPALEQTVAIIEHPEA